MIVCDGFTGNIALKVSEGLVEMIGGLLRELGGAAWATSWRRGSAASCPTCSAGGWTIRSTAACRCSASPGSP